MNSLTPCHSSRRGMSHFFLSLVCFVLSINSLNTVRILGIFPQRREVPSGYSKSSSVSHWTTQCMAMFRAAITLANRYKICAHDGPINYTILKTTTDGNGFGELDLVCRSIINKTEPDVVGVVGPTSSTNARFLAPFAAHIDLPLVSYAASNAKLDDTLTYGTFYRTVPSDTLLAEAIVQLFKLFSWTTCTMILGKDDYGYGGLEILSETYHANLSIQDRLIFDPRLDIFHANLKQTLEKSRSRIVLVWANQNASTRIIQHALKAELLGGSYVWLMTNKIDFNAIEPTNWSKLEGILAVVPIIHYGDTFGINETLQKEAFNAWSNSLEDSDSFPEDLSSISPFAMYTFDAVWTLIQALNKSSFGHNAPRMEKSSQCFDSLLVNHSTYHMHLRNTRFLGVSGIIQFSKNYSNDRIDGAFYALYNVQWERQRSGITNQEPEYEQVMIWSETMYSWKNATVKTKIDIIWPSNKFEEAPPDFPQLNGQFLRILVMEAPPFVIVRNISAHGQNWNSINHAEQVSCLSEPLKTKIPHIVICGFIADFIRELQQQMHFNYTIDVADPTTNYHKLATSVANDSRQYDIILSNIRITSNRLLTVDFSTPFHENTFRIITRQNPYSSTLSLFNCFNPFTWKVWVAILAVIIYSGIIIYLFERQSIKTENTKSRVRSISIGVCQALTSVLIMNGDVPLTTNSSRLTVLGLYALGIILVATYTANLSSFLTLNRAQPSISGIDDIKNGRLPFSHIGIVTNSAISDYYIQNISTTYYPLTTAEEIYSRLLDYTIDASIWDSSVLEYATNNHYCDKLTVVGVGFVKSSFGVVLPKDWIYKKDLDVHILALRESERLEVLENMWLGKRNCPSTSRNTDNNAGGSASDTLSLDVMSGFFLTFLILTAVAFGLHLWHCRAPIVANIGQIIKLPTKF